MTCSVKNEKRKTKNIIHIKEMKTIKDYINEGGCCGSGDCGSGDKVVTKTDGKEEKGKKKKTRTKEIKEERSDVEPWMLELAELMDCENIDDIQEEGIDNPYGVDVESKMYSYGNQEWVVFASWEDAERAAIEENKRVCEECGFPTETCDIEDFVSDSFIERVADEEGDHRREDYEYENPREDDEDDDDYEARCEKAYDEAYNEVKDDFVGYMSGLFGKDELTKWLIENNAIDLDKFAEFCVRSDGVFHLLAGYDGNYYELSDDKYCCRWN